MSHPRQISTLVQHITSGDVQKADEVFHALLEARVLAIMQDEDVPSFDAACETCDDDEHAALYEAMKKKAEDDETEDDEEDENEKEDEGEENEERPKKKKLFGKQSKLDMNKNGALDKQDFKMLRAKKSMSESQRYPLSGHAYHGKSDAELRFISKDAADAARAMKNHDAKAEAKYLDQVNDAATVQHWRKQHGLPDWYKNKYGHGKKSVRESLIDALRDLLTEGPVKRTNKAAKNEFYRRRSNKTARELHHELDDVPMRGWQRDSIEKQIDQHHANPLEAQRARERENTTHTLRGKLTLGSDSNAAMVGRQKMSLADKKKNLKMWQGFRKTSVDHKGLYHQPKLPKPVREQVVQYLSGLLTETGEVKRANKAKKAALYSYKNTNQFNRGRYGRKGRKTLPNSPRTEGSASGPRKMPPRSEMSAREFRQHVIKNSGLLGSFKKMKPIKEGAIKRVNKENKRNVIAMIGAGQASMKDRYALKPRVMQQNQWALKDKENVKKGRDILRKRSEPSLLRKKWDRQDKFFFGKGKPTPDRESSYRSASVREYMKDEVVHYLRTMLAEGRVKRENKAKKAAWENRVGKTQLLQRKHPTIHPSMAFDNSPVDGRKETYGSMARKAAARHKRTQKEQVMHHFRNVLAEGPVKRENKRKKAAWEEKVGKREMLSRAHGLLRKPSRRQSIGVRAGVRNSYYGLLHSATSASGARDRKAVARQLRKESLIRNLQNALSEGRIKAENKAKKRLVVGDIALGHRTSKGKSMNVSADVRRFTHGARRHPEAVRAGRMAMKG